MRLNNDVEATGAYEAVCAREGEAERGHYFCDADGGGAGNADAAVDEGGGAVAFAAAWLGVSGDLGRGDG